MAEDTKDVRNQAPGPESPYSESQAGNSNLSNATKQPGGQSRELQRGQESPIKDVKKGEKQKKENQKTGKH